MIRDAIVHLLKQYKLILDTHHGFMEGHSYLTNLFIFLEQVTQYVEQGYQVDAIYLDFQKTFHKVQY